MCCRVRLNNGVSFYWLGGSGRQFFGHHNWHALYFNAVVFASRTLIRYWLFFLLRNELIYTYIHAHDVTVLFLLGKPLYRLKYPKENIMLNFMNCILVSCMPDEKYPDLIFRTTDIIHSIQYAAKKRLSAEKLRPTQSHWLDYASDRFPTKLIADIKIVLAIFFLYIPLPLFWSLFDQQVRTQTPALSKLTKILT